MKKLLFILIPLCLTGCVSSNFTLVEKNISEPGDKFLEFINSSNIVSEVSEVSEVIDLSEQTLAMSDYLSKTYFNSGMMFLSMDTLNDLKGTGITIDDDATVLNFGVGYNVSPNLALEAGILTEEEISASISDGVSGTINGIAFTVNATASVKAKANNTYLLGIKYSSATESPLNFNVKVGQMFWDVDYIASINGIFVYGGATYTVSEELEFDSAKGNDPYLGFGVTYDLSDTSSFGLDYFASEIDDDSISGFSLAYMQKF